MVCMLIVSGAFKPGNVMAAANKPASPSVQQASAPITASSTAYGMAFSQDKQIETFGAESTILCVAACDLYAKNGVLALPGGVTVPIWGFSDTPGGAAEMPGPVLIVNEGDTVNVTLHNDVISETVALAFPGQDLLPDLTGVASGGSMTYTFTASLPGTFSYEAGLTPNGTRQVAMGLYGMLIVRPISDPFSAYGSGTNSQFDTEALLVLSEIDPAFNADPAGFSMVDFTPSYWLLNGKAYTQTTSIPTAAGQRVLLRYLNAGVQERTMGLLGLRQVILGADGNFLGLVGQYSVVAETFGAGQTQDAITEIPLTAPAGSKYPLLNTGFQQDHNAGALASPGGPVAFGGIITFLEVAGVFTPPDVGPLASNVLVLPNPTASTNDVTLSALLDETNTGGSAIVAAEYFTDTIGINGAGIPLSVPVSATIVSVSDTIAAATLAGWPAGDVTFYVHGQDALGNWGAFNSDVLDLVKAGPVIQGMLLTPNPTNGSADVTIQATADDSSTGEVNVVAAEFFMDATGPDGSGQAMSLNIIAPVTSLTATLPAATVVALSEGEHTLYIHALDELGNWGGFGTINLRLDKTGPGATGNSVGPNPNNGFLGINSTTIAVRLVASFTDMGVVSSNLERAEGFIDATGVDGSGFPLMAQDALFNGTSETAFVDIPLLTIRNLAQGPHTIYFHAKDVAGNWGNFGSMTLIVDKTGPAVSSIATVPAAPPPATTFMQLGAILNDPVNGAAPASTIIQAEWFEGTDPGQGNGNPMSPFDGFFNSPSESVIAVVNIGGYPNGLHTFSVRGKDIAGNWGAVASVTRNITGNVLGPILIDGFEMGNFSAWSSHQGSVNVTGESVMDGGSFGMRAAINDATADYVADRTPSAETDYRASFFFNPNTADTAGESVRIFSGQDATSSGVFGIEFERSASGPEIRAWVLAGGVPVYTQWVHISDAATRIGLTWQSSENAEFKLLLNGEVHETLSGLNTSASRLETVWLGPSAGVSIEMSGTMYFDGFHSQRAAIAYIYLPFLLK